MEVDMVIAAGLFSPSDYSILRPRTPSSTGLTPTHTRATTLRNLLDLTSPAPPNSPYPLPHTPPVFKAGLPTPSTTPSSHPFPLHSHVIEPDSGTSGGKENLDSSMPSTQKLPATQIRLTAGAEPPIAREPPLSTIPTSTRTLSHDRRKAKPPPLSLSPSPQPASTPVLSLSTLQTTVAATLPMHPVRTVDAFKAHMDDDTLLLAPLHGGGTGDTPVYPFSSAFATHFATPPTRSPADALRLPLTGASAHTTLSPLLGISLGAPYRSPRPSRPPFSPYPVQQVRILQDAQDSQSPLNPQTPVSAPPPLRRHPLRALPDVHPSDILTNIDIFTPLPNIDLFAPHVALTNSRPDIEYTLPLHPQQIQPGMHAPQPRRAHPFNIRIPVSSPLVSAHPLGNIERNLGLDPDSFSGATQPDSNAAAGHSLLRPFATVPTACVRTPLGVPPFSQHAEATPDLKPDSPSPKLPTTSLPGEHSNIPGDNGVLVDRLTELHHDSAGQPLQKASTDTSRSHRNSRLDSLPHSDILSSGHPRIRSPLYQDAFTTPSIAELTIRARRCADALQVVIMSLPSKTPFVLHSALATAVGTLTDTLSALSVLSPDLDNDSGCKPAEHHATAQSLERTLDGFMRLLGRLPRTEVRLAAFADKTAAFAAKLAHIAVRLTRGRLLRAKKILLHAREVLRLDRKAWQTDRNMTQALKAASGNIDDQTQGRKKYPHGRRDNRDAWSADREKWKADKAQKDRRKKEREEWRARRAVVCQMHVEYRTLREDFRVLIMKARACTESPDERQYFRYRRATEA